MKKNKLLILLVAISMVLSIGVGFSLKVSATGVPKYAPTAPPKDGVPKYAPTAPSKDGVPKYAPTAPKYAPTAPSKDSVPKYAPTAPSKDGVPKYAPTAPPKDGVPKYAPTAPSKAIVPKYAPTAPQQYVSAPCEQGTNNSSSLTSSSFQSAFVSALNSYRNSRGISSVSSGSLSSYTNTRTREIQTVWSHTRPNGEKFSKFYFATSSSTRFVGENLQQSPWSKKLQNMTAEQLAEYVLESWKDSPSHNSLLLDSRLKYATISYYISGNTFYVCLWMNG